MIPFLDLKKQLEPIREEIIQKLIQITDSGNYILGDEVKLFEKEIAQYLGVKHAIGVANGSDALVISLMSLGIKKGDEVITTPFTFFATAGAISRIGATPVFVDIELETYNINTSLIKEKITNKTKAILPVHIFGQSADMDEINKIAKEHNLFVIEDACQSIGAEYKGKKVGTLGDVSCFSFFPTKNLGCFGDGGLITTNNDKLAEFIRKARVHGSQKKYYHEFVGINSRLDELQAGILRIKLKHLDSWNEARIKIAKKYSEALRNEFTTPKIDKNCKHVFHQYALLEKNQEERTKIMQKLKNNNIASGIYYPVPLHLQECFKNLNYKEGDLPNSENISKRVFSLPIYPEVDSEKIINILLNE